MFFPIFFFTLLLPLLFHSSHCTTILVDGSSEWKNPTVHIGDSIIFTHKQHYNIYIFKNQKAFNLCNFTQATLLTNPNTASYTWHPSRRGLFYFSFNDGSFKACQGSEKLAIEVSSAMPPQLAPLSDPPAPFSGEVSPSPSPSPSPLFPWHFHPLQEASPAPSPAPSASVTVPLYKSGTMPFINSNPAVPLPTDEADSAIIHPLPASTAHQLQVMIGSFGLLAVHTIALLLL